MPAATVKLRAHTAPSTCMLPAGSTAASLAKRARYFFDHAADTRGRRVVTLLAAVWVMSLFDYAYTVTGLDSGLVDECNPLALRAAQYGFGALLAFKLVLMGPASIGMYLARRRALTEATLIAVAVAFVIVLLRWEFAYDMYEFTERMAPPGYPLWDGVL